MMKIAMILMLASTAFAEETGAPKNGHRFCIDFLNRNFSKDGLDFKANMLFTADGRMIGLPASDSANEIVHLQSKSEPPPSTPAALSQTGSNLEYRLYQGKDLKFKAFHLVHTVTEKTKNIKLESSRRRVVSDKVLKQLTLVNADVRFGWDEKKGDCTVEKFTRTKLDVTTKKEIVLLYPTVEQCNAFRAASGDHQNSLIEDYLVTTEQSGFESPYITLAEFKKKDWVSDNKPTYVPSPVLTGCERTYGQLLAPRPAASSSASPAAVVR